MIWSATLKLTLSYLGILMLLSLMFSVALYRESADQIVNNARHQGAAIARLPLPMGMESRRADVLANLESDLENDLDRIKLRLVILNLVTLALGGAAAYGLARWTLRPIEDALEAQGRFTADASHELRTPLTAMRSEIEVALRAPKLADSEARELLTSNLEEIAKLEALSSSLLRLARSDGGLDPAAVTTVPVADIFEQAAHRFAAVIAEREVDLQIDAGSTTVSGDRDSLIELVAILLDNAIKYSPTRSAVKLEASPAGHFARLTVTDHGAGIKSADVPHIFDRFYRADRSRSKDKIEGYGLGLSIAKRIVELHRGTITVTSAVGKGTSFKIKLPVQAAPERRPYLPQ